MVLQLRSAIAIDRSEMLRPVLTGGRATSRDRYGKEFAARAMAMYCVNERVLHKLSCEPPNAFLVMQYMKEIAKQYAVAWDPNGQTAARPFRIRISYCCTHSVRPRW